MKFRNRRHEHILSILLSLAGLGIVLAFLILSKAGDEEELAQAQYCAMVHMYQQDPATGWPDFNHTYESECENGEPTAR